MSVLAIRFCLLLGGLTYGLSAMTQSSDYPYANPQYDFIHYDSNRIVFPGDSDSWENFLTGFSKLIREGDRQLSIVHIGGSHIQADIYSDRVRRRFQTFQPGNNAGRGLVFPYSVARTNNPSNYRVKYRGRWTSCKNTGKNRSCPLGLTGISVTTRDSTATISIDFPEENRLSYDFNRLKVFYLGDSLSYDCGIQVETGISERRQSDSGILTLTLDQHVDRLQLNLKRTNASQVRFTLFGISLETDDPGLVYHSIGVNGAKIPSYLRCTLLSEHLSVLSPDLVIISLGTNDAYTRYFNSQTYKQNYTSLIQTIRNTVPGASIMLTVPNDSYLYRRYVNRNTEQARDVIMELAEQYNCGVWDFYTIMGGLNSIIVWQRFGLAKRDRIHFTRKGYLLKGDLFFNAFLKSYDQYIDNINRAQNSKHRE